MQSLDDLVYTLQVSNTVGKHCVHDRNWAEILKLDGVKCSNVYENNFSRFRIFFWKWDDFCLKFRRIGEFLVTDKYHQSLEYR